MRYIVFFLIYWLVGIGVMVSYEPYRNGNAGEIEKRFVWLLWPAVVARVGMDALIKHNGYVARPPV